MITSRHTQSLLCPYLHVLDNLVDSFEPHETDEIKGGVKLAVHRGRQVDGDLQCHETHTYVTHAIVLYGVKCIYKLELVQPITKRTVPEITKVLNTDSRIKYYKLLGV